MLKEISLLTLVCTLCCGEQLNQFRFDYKFSERADGWLKLHYIPATWSEARIRCHAEGAILVSPLSKQLQLAIIEHVVREKGPDTCIIFTGIHSTFSKGDYTSVEGVPLSNLPIIWAPGEPDNYENSESCLAMLTSSNGTMMDVKCHEVFPYVCYKKKTQTLKITECGTHDTEYSLNSRTGKCYKFHRRGLTWHRAFAACVAEGAHLAIINSEEEFVALRELFGQNPDDVIFSKETIYAALGFSDPNDGGSWITVHGETLKEAGFERWESGEPNNASQPVGELCGVMYRGNGNFYDAPCYWSLAFICEKEPKSLQSYIEV